MVYMAIATHNSETIINIEPNYNCQCHISSKISLNSRELVILLLWVFPLFLKRFPWVACTLKWYSHQQFYYTNQYIRKVFNNLIYSTKTWHITSTNELTSHLLPHTDVLRLGRNPITGIDSISLMFNDMLDTCYIIAFCQLYCP